MTTTTTVADAPEQSPDLTRRQLGAVTGCYFVASFAALGLPPYLTEILPALGDEEARWAGLLYVVPTVFSAVGGPVWGRLADRFGHKALLLRAQLGLSLAFVLAGLADSLTLFTIALVLQGVLGGTYAASTGYLGSALRDSGEMARALTLMQMAARASLVAAPIVVGALTPWVPPHRQYLLLAVLPLAAAATLALLPSAPRPVRQTREAPAPQSPWRHPVGLYALEFGFVFSTVVSFPYLIVLVHDAVPATSGAVAGLLFALPHLCFLLTAMPLHEPVSRRPRTGLVAGLLLVALALAGHATADTLTGLIVVRLCFGAGLTLGLVGLSSLTAEAARDRPPGALFGWAELFSKGGAVASGLAATAAMAVAGPTGPVVCGTVAALVLAVGTTLVSFFSSHPSTTRSKP